MNTETNRNSVDSNLNRCGIDEQSLRDLKAVFVRKQLKRRSQSHDEIEIVCAFSPDRALAMLRSEHKWEAHVLEYVESAERAMKTLAFNVDAGLTDFEQAEADSYEKAEWDAAMAVLRSKYANRAGPDAETTLALERLENCG